MDYKEVQKNKRKCLWHLKGLERAVPKDLVEKQYGKAIKVEEVTKVVDLALERFLQSERLNLGSLPK
jgi:trigger factor